MSRSKRFSVVKEVKAIARERIGSPKPSRVFDDHDFNDFCRYCKADPCMCDDLYEAHREDVDYEWESVSKFLTDNPDGNPADFGWELISGALRRKLRS